MIIRKLRDVDFLSKKKQTITEDSKRKDRQVSKIQTILIPTKKKKKNVKYAHFFGVMPGFRTPVTIEYMNLGILFIRPNMIKESSLFQHHFNIFKLPYLSVEPPLTKTE